MTQHEFYRCPDPDCAQAALGTEADGLYCPNGHRYAFAPGTDVPIFDSEPDGGNEYALHDAAERHDNALAWVFATFGETEENLRRRLAARIELEPGQRVLITGAGAGNDLPYLAAELKGQGEIHTQDIAKEMLLAGRERHAGPLCGDGLVLYFSASDASHLPYEDGFFDAAYHFGGINLFPDIACGMAEMNRVVRAGGKVVVGDEGLAPWMRDTDVGRMLINNNALYACPVPLEHIPTAASDVRVTWELSNCFYVIEFRAGRRAPAINIDIPHVGTRGGTIRTRYAGQIEGIEPDLRNRLYAEAEKRGLSRVEMIEKLVKSELEKG